MTHKTYQLAALTIASAIMPTALDARRMFRYEAGTDPEPQPQPNGQEPPQTDPPAAGQEPTDPPAGEPNDVQSLPEWAKNLVAELRGENAKHRKAAKAAETAAAQAEEAQLAEQAKWQELAEKRQARLAELEPLSEDMKALTESIAVQMNAEIADWPDEVKALAPDGEVSPVVMLDFLSKHRPLAAKLAAPPAPNGNGPGPKPRGAARKPEDITSPINVRRTF